MSDPTPVRPPSTHPEGAPSGRPGHHGHRGPQLRRDRTAPVEIRRLGRVPYREAWDLQRRLVADRQSDRGRDTLLLLEHPPVYTLGRRADRANLLLDAAALAARGIEVVEVDRGGDITYHGPGQLVGYPVLRLAGTRDVVDYVRALEEVLLRTLAALGVPARRVAGLTGVWVGEEKIAAIGVRVASGGVTSHGFALNVAPVLEDFTGIVPCGIADRGVCSLASLGVTASMATVSGLVVAAFGEVFAATLVDGPATGLDPDALVPDHRPQPRRRSA
ncbi:MAG: lipoyl(octanoyl) transferase LipB [Nitriliruptoraceae bacterium]